MERKKVIIFAGLTALISLVIIFLFAQFPGANETPVQEEVPECKGCNIIIIEFDSISKGRIGIYGNPRNATPNIDAFSKEAFLFSEAYSPAAFTYDSDVSLFTGMRPTETGAYRIYDKKKGVEVENFNSSLPFLPRELSDKGGYESAAFVTAQTFSENHFKAVGFSNKSRETESFEYAVNSAENWLSARKNRSEPALLFIQAFDLHDPHYGEGGDFFVGMERFAGSYSDPDWQETYISRKNASLLLYNRTTDKPIREFRPEEVVLMRDIYDGKLRELDRLFGEFLVFLREEGLYDKSIIVLTGEHGEALGENGDFGHGWVSPETLAVPLIVKFPGEKSARVFKGPVSTRLLYGTLKESALGKEGLEKKNTIFSPREYAVSETAVFSTDFSWTYYEVGFFLEEKLVKFGYNPKRQSLWLAGIYANGEKIEDLLEPGRSESSKTYWEIERDREGRRRELSLDKIIEISKEEGYSLEFRNGVETASIFN